ncbi:MAG: hypothetical protein GY869_11770 [Planctomycetes bacterium]|nr:hypothetical protein [Planctomycetota bacterium]
MTEPQLKKTETPKPKPKRLKRWLKRCGIALAILVILYVLFRVFYPVWIESQLPEDAPRIAFCLDNSFLGLIGITDASYQRVAAAAGGRLVELRPDMAGDPVVDEQAVRKLLEENKIDGILFTGGGDVDPEIFGGTTGANMLVHRLRDDFELALFRVGREKGMPMLGICRGCQLINVALGGTVRNLRHEEEFDGSHLVKNHPVEVIPDSVLAETLGTEHLDEVVSLHGQVVGELGDGVRVAAIGGVGDLPEAIEADTPGGRGWIVGIQWHPELTVNDTVQHKVYQTLVERARQWRRRR